MKVYQAFIFNLSLFIFVGFTIIANKSLQRKAEWTELFILEVFWADNLMKDL